MSKYKKISSKIQKLTIDNPENSKKKIDWYNISKAQKQEIEFLRKNFDFKFDQLQASSSKIKAQRPAVFTDKGQGYVFIILQFPTFKGSRLESSEINFFIGPGYLVTIHDNNIKTLDTFFNSCKKENNSSLSSKFESSAILLYEVLYQLMLNSFSILDKNSEEIDKAEQTIFSSSSGAKKVNSKILELKRNVLNLRKIIQNHKNILKQLSDMKSRIVPKKALNKYYNTLVEHSKRIWEISDNQKEHIDALYHTNASLTNYQINNIMKILTIFSIVVLPLNLVASIFGTNFEYLPLTSHENGFWIVITVMIICSLSILLFFTKKRWL